MKINRMSGKTLRFTFGKVGVLLCAGLMSWTTIGAGAIAPASPAAGIDIGKPRFPVGSIRRCSLTAADLPVIRERLKDPIGAVCWIGVRGGAFGTSGDVLAEKR